LRNAFSALAVQLFLNAHFGRDSHPTSIAAYTSTFEYQRIEVNPESMPVEMPQPGKSTHW